MTDLISSIQKHIAIHAQLFAWKNSETDGLEDHVIEARLKVLKEVFRDKILLKRSGAKHGQFCREGNNVNEARIR